MSSPPNGDKVSNNETGASRERGPSGPARRAESGNT
jgi:hypothetical protein